ncbi:hypothetical protein [Lacimicrobium alkaliphilum]|uniref:Addiction module toxin RelE n=1 Tax=Lacimicrobium alkaliphilum TaxID=1526571 RepID=A0ABQ1RHP7_9ALTE|nr:hypothetical protein GCM10011357_27440 [Lacimicrobium alkaliphilum]
MWVVETTDTFDEWFDALDDTDRANVLASDREYTVHLGKLKKR